MHLAAGLRRFVRRLLIRRNLGPDQRCRGRRSRLAATRRREILGRVFREDAVQGGALPFAPLAGEDDRQGI
jgi:hypothetical protein